MQQTFNFNYYIPLPCLKLAASGRSASRKARSTEAPDQHVPEAANSHAGVVTAFGSP